MKTPLRILMIEDSEDDSRMVERALAKGGFEFAGRRVETQDAVAAALREGGWDLVLSDFNIPGFGGAVALKMVKAASPDLPFLLVSGAIGDENAADIVNAGADDCINKSNLHRLVPTVNRVLEARRERAARAAFEAAAAQGEIRLKAVLAHLPIALYQADVSSGAVSWATESLGRLSGFPPEQFLTDAEFWPSRLHPDDRARVLDGFADISTAGKLKMEYRWQTSDGSYRWFLDKAQLLPEEAGAARRMLGVWIDITEQKLQQQRLLDTAAQLAQAQKMESVGRLAGGVAHDFNNILTAIGGYGYFLMEGLPPGDPKREDVSEIIKAADRASALTRQLLAFSRRQPLGVKIFDCNGLVSNLEKMLRRIIGEDIELATVLDPAAGRVKGDPGQIEQIVLNLVVNAKDAMAKGGRITLKTSNAELGPDAVLTHLKTAPGAYVLISVADTGSGMDAGTMSRLFEPFFTTKEQGKGTGLGLSTVHGIVAQSGGGISVVSAPGRGTTFSIYLPRVMKEAAPVEDRRPAAAPAAGTETILLVEDDAQVRAFLERALRAGGYAVLAAEDPRAALALSQRHKGPVHLVISDVILPQMPGPDLFARLSAQRPESKVLYMSGYTGTNDIHRGLVESGAPFLQKPIAPDALALAVRAALDRGRAS